MEIRKLFNVEYGINLELVNCELTDASDPKGINFIGRTSVNNGVVAKVKKIEGKEPQAAGLITCAGGGSVLSTFVQTKPFYSGRDLYILMPINDMTFNEKLFYCMCIKNNAYRYSYGRQANKTLKDIEVPDNIPDWVNLRKTEKPTTLVPCADLKPDTHTWKEFQISGPNGLFELQSCNCANAGDLEKGNEIYYVGAKKNDNGIMNRVAHNSDLTTKGNCIVFICDGQGSVGYSNYMEQDFIGSTTLSVGYNKNLNKYTGLFLVAVLDLERPKYSFGRKYRKNLSSSKIKLPAKADGTPDWDYMEQYMKSLPYSDKID